MHAHLKSNQIAMYVPNALSSQKKSEMEGKKESKGEKWRDKARQTEGKRAMV